MKLLAALAQYALTIITVVASSSSISSPWATMQISSQEICSMPFGNFRVKIYEHLGNQKSILSRKKYFYAPIAVLDHFSAVCVPNGEELRFRVELWNEKVENDVANYLGKIVGERVEAHQVQVIPLEKMILTTESLSSYVLPSTWMPINLQKSLWFTATGLENQEYCQKLAIKMRTSPQQFQAIQVHFALSPHQSETKEIKIVASGPTVNKLLRRFEKEQEVFITGNDEKRLLTEVTSATIKMESLNIVVASESKIATYNFNKGLFISPLTLTVTKQSDPHWTSVFWNDEKYRPDKSSQVLNYIYENLSEENRKKFSDAFTSSNKTIDFPKIVSSLLVSEFRYNLSSVYSKEYLENLYDESKDHINWAGGKFEPKTCVLNKINLKLLRELQQLDSINYRELNISYTTTALSIPININQQTDWIAAPEVCGPLQGIVAHLTKELNGK